MTIFMILHALVGTAVVCSGGTALLLRKGSLQHKLAGRLFVISMVLMGPVIAIEAFFTPGSVSPLGILFVLLVVYLVVSAWSTISHPEHMLNLLDRAAPVLALCISMACLIVGIDAMSVQTHHQDLPPKEAYFFFAALAFVAMLLDIRNVRVGGVRGRHRIVRHVWRMSCALFFATSTLFTGPGAVVFPESVRGNAVLSIPQLLVVIFACFWTYRLIFSRSAVTSP